MAHHHRRKSGHASANSSTTDVRKAVTLTELSAKYSSKSSRPAPMTRRTTPQSAQKLGKSPRDREREWDEERWWEDERESFPQFWYVKLVKLSPLLALILHICFSGCCFRGAVFAQLPHDFPGRLLLPLQGLPLLSFRRFT